MNKKQSSGKTDPVYDDIKNNLSGSLQELLSKIESTNLDKSDKLIDETGKELPLEELLQQASRSDVLEALQNKKVEQVDDITKESEFKGSNTNIEKGDIANTYEFNEKSEDGKEEYNVKASFIKKGNKNIQVISSGSTKGTTDTSKGLFEASGKDELTFKPKDGGSIKIKENQNSIDYDVSKNTSYYDMGKYDDQSNIIFSVNYEKGEKGEKGEKLDINVNEELWSKGTKKEINFKLNDNESISFQKGENGNKGKFLHTKNGETKELESQRDDKGNLNLKIDYPNFKEHEKQKNMDKILNGKEFKDSSKKLSSAKQEKEEKTPTPTYSAKGQSKENSLGI